MTGWNGRRPNAGIAEGDSGARSRFLFVTLGHVESDFYGRVGRELVSRGHEVGHLTYSRRAAHNLSKAGYRTFCLPDLMDALGPIDVEGEAERIASTYDTPTFRDIYRTDYVCDSKDERWCIERTVRHVLAIEQVFDAWKPTVVVPEVGNETIRTVAHLVGVQRAIPVLFLFYTIFPDPLRLYVDAMHAPIVEPHDVTPISQAERLRVERFIDEFVARDAPIREYRTSSVTPHRGRMLARHIAVKALYDRDNPYLRPGHQLLGFLRQAVRARLASAFYSDLPEARPFVYFPLHVVDDYKLKRVIPHCADQTQIVAHVARSLPHGYDLVLKEHPMSIGRNSLVTLARLSRMNNVRLVAPRTSSHRLIDGAEAVVVISSTVGLEALLHGKPVLTLGRPFYAGMGVTRDLDGPVGLREAVPAVLNDLPDRQRTLEFLSAAMNRCHPGAPVLVDRSDENAAKLGASLDLSAGELAVRRLGAADVAAAEGSDRA